MDVTEYQQLRRRLETNLGRFQSRRLDDGSLRRAAVALVIVNQGAGEEPAILLTRRPKRLNQHSGQYALPGGKLDENENAVQAALRELDEELGIHLGHEAVLGRLDDYPTRSKFLISPVVVWAESGHVLKPSADEVARVYHIPFSELDSEAIPVFEEGVEADRPVLASEFPTIGHRMYSPTAAMIYQFREVVLRGQDTRVAHYDQPRFAWK